MLGLGHTPENVIEVMGRPCVMANVMTPQVGQMRLVNAMKAEIGHTRDTGCPFTGFLFMNSGSESVTVGLRIVDINAKIETDTGGVHAGMPCRRLSLRGSFHGRTDRPAAYSDSARLAYEKHLASFRDRNKLIVVEANDVEGLHAAFTEARERAEFIEAVLIEPVMGEGNPGVAVTREFYDAARTLTTENGAMFLVDSIQAGLRAQGCLSIIDYPGFEDCEPPDMETYSKALNAGQYPLSVLAMSPRAAELFTSGVYGNTMTANARAMDIGVTVLESITPELRANIRERGAELVEKLKALAEELDGPIVDVQGTGLLVSCALDAERYKAYGTESVEEYMRMHGIGVIHGGKNALRFTPHFRVTSAELDLIVDAIRDAVL
jgi:acetylornithine/succinyldiaminopimelate/putrescine aminotransferase